MYVDESGSMSRASVPVQNPLSFGVVVGVLLPEAEKLSFEKDVDNLLKKYHIVLGSQSHITAEKDIDRESFRKDLFLCIREKHSKIRVIFNVITSIGFHYVEWENENLAVMEFKKYLAIKGRSVSTNLTNDNAHSELIAGLIIKANCALEDCFGERPSRKTNLNMFFDKVDKETYDRAIKRIEDFSQDNKSYVTKVFNKTSGSIEKNEVRFATTGMPQYYSANLTHKIVEKTNVGVYCADVLSNTIYWHLKNKIVERLSQGLNTIEALDDFELKTHLYASENDFSDNEYGFGPCKYLFNTLSEGSDDHDEHVS